MKATRLIMPLLVCAAMASCTVKEDRGPCPCILDIFMEDSRAYADKIAVSGWSDAEGRLFLDKVDLDMYPSSYPKKVDKGILHVCAYCGNETMIQKGDKLVIPEGKPCDPVWAYRGDPLDASGETAEDHILLHKQYAVVHIRADLPEDTQGGLLLRAVGTSNGFDISTLAPSKGSFHCFTTLDEENHHLVTVPRQHDDSLELEVFLDGVLTRRIRAGELIANSGYSWEREDLEDIYLTLNLFTPGSIGISMDNWDTEVHTFTF